MRMKKDRCEQCVEITKNVPFLHGKSFSRVKSFFRAVKCFSMSDPFAPRVVLCCPSLRGLAKGHERGKWITNGKTFHARIMISRGKLFTSWEWDFVQWELELRIFWVFFHVGKMISRLYLATAFFLHCFLHKWRKQWRNGFLSSFSSRVKKTVKKKAVVK